VLKCASAHFFILADIIAKRRTSACMLALAGCFVHALHNFPGKVFGIIFAHAFEQRLHHYGFRAIVESFKDAVHTDAALSKLTLVHSRIITVTGKTVELMYQNHIKKVLFAVGDHFLKHGSPVR